VGYHGKLEEKIKARNLRKQGLSYNEIRKKIPVSKSTLSLWCRDVVLTLEQLERLKGKKLQGAERGRFISAKKQQTARISRTKKLMAKGRAEVGDLNRRDQFIAGIALYAADGSKRDGECNFANSNPLMIKFMMQWFRRFLNLPEEKFRGAIWIHDNLDEKKARNYWSNLTGIPLGQFRKSYIAKNKINSKKIRKNKHQYGVFSIRFSGVRYHRRVMGWIAGILGKSWYNLERTTNH